MIKADAEREDRLVSKLYTQDLDHRRETQVAY